MIEEKATRTTGQCTSAEILLPNDCTGLRAEPDFADADWLAGQDVDVTIFVRTLAHGDRFFKSTLQTGAKGNGDMSFYGLHDDILFRGASAFAKAECHDGKCSVGVRLVAVREGEQMPAPLTKPVAVVVEGVE